jgi:hypothetical protein
MGIISFCVAHILKKCRHILWKFLARISGGTDITCRPIVNVFLTKPTDGICIHEEDLWVEWEVLCDKCATTFSIARDVKSELSHNSAASEIWQAQNSDYEVPTTASASRFFRSITLGDTEQKLAAIMRGHEPTTQWDNRTLRSSACRLHV